MQPSQFEIQREVEALRDIRRRSTAQGGPGSLILDPDLPATSSPSAPSTSYWPPTVDDSSSSSHEDSTDNGSAAESDDPSHLFWVPARLHPEIAPAEFRAFLKEHARTPTDGISRSNSVSSQGLGRKKSMLSRQYSPSANDNIEEETVVPIRKRTSVFANPGPQLTISDLQKLEELAEEASRSDDPTRLRAVLRRSMSLNLAPSVIDQMDDIPDIADDADSPIIVPRPGQVLRRAARTKIRKAGQTTEGAHRFTGKRARRASGGRSATLEPRTSSDRSSSDHGDGDRARGEHEIPEIPPVPQRNSYSEESSIYDAYAREDSDDMEPPVIVTAADYSNEYAQAVAAPTPIPQPEPPVELPYVPPGQIVSPTPIHHPQPQRMLAAPQPPTPANLRTPSPEGSSPSVSPDASPQSVQVRPPLQEAAMYQPPASPSPSESQRREKDKKPGLFGKWGSDKGGKRSSKEKEKEKDSFFGSIFGRKKQDDQPPPVGGIGTGGREMAANILGPSKSSKNYVPPPSPTPAGGYARYPIHVERAIYRLSHIKLANPRRPLYEQVLISNLMFWYLGVINKNQNGNAQPAATPAANGSSEKEQAEREKKEMEEREKAEKERADKEREKERVEQKREPRRGSLTKAPSPGTPGARRAEQMAVRDPQYGVQHRAMEQEYAYNQPGNGQAGRGGPPGGVGYQGNRGMGGASNQYPQSVQLVQPQPQAPGQNRYYNGVGNPPNQQYGMGPGASQLPPGAMPPVNVEQGGWLNNPQPGMVPMARGSSSSQTPPQQRTVSPPHGQQAARRTRSPPPPGQGRYAPGQEKQTRLPGRSLSATAAPPIPPVPQPNGKLRKGSSAHAVIPHQRITSEEEDLPLAVYQQQRRK